MAERKKTQCDCGKSYATIITTEIDPQDGHITEVEKSICLLCAILYGVEKPVLTGVPQQQADEEYRRQKFSRRLQEGRIKSESGQLVSCWEEHLESQQEPLGTKQRKLQAEVGIGYHKPAPLNAEQDKYKGNYKKPAFGKRKQQTAFGERLEPGSTASSKQHAEWEMEDLASELEKLFD